KAPEKRLRIKEKYLLAGLEDLSGFQNAICGHDPFFILGVLPTPLLFVYGWGHTVSRQGMF
ncbi:MAG: hypothetical protein M1591_07175, partial [Deltaproteobacteria bacterium]|nr:hypothetical protein [Deltaproteobacteria bacterium]